MLIGSSLKTDSLVSGNKSIVEIKMTSQELKLGSYISADTDNFVCYCKYGNTFAVTKGLFAGLDDSFEVYEREIKNQEKFAELGWAPKLLQINVRALKKGRKFVMWVSEDAGLPIEDADISAANALLDEMYDKGYVLSDTIFREHFVKGFDGKIRVTDFKNAEIFEHPILKDKRVYI